MRATIYFIDMTDRDVALLEKEIIDEISWRPVSSEAVQRYNNAVAGQIDISNFDMLQCVAVIYASCAMEIYQMMTDQPGIPWTNISGQKGVEYVAGPGLRSLRAGDLIVWEDGLRQSFVLVDGRAKFIQWNIKPSTPVKKDSSDDIIVTKKDWAQIQKGIKAGLRQTSGPVVFTINQANDASLLKYADELIKSINNFQGFTGAMVSDVELIKNKQDER